MPNAVTATDVPTAGPQPLPGKTRAERPSISVVVPAYNEAANLPSLLEQLSAALPALTGGAWEVIVVDDGSRDATPLAMLPWLERPGVRYLRLSRNFGKEAALTCGIDHAQGQLVALMDADGQHPVELLAQMLQLWREGADVICAVRRSREDEGPLKRWGTKLFYRMANAGSQVQIPRDVGDFRLMDRCVVDALKALPERNRFMKGLYAWVGFDARQIPYLPTPRRSGASTFSARRLAKLAFTGITAFSNFPLRVWSGVGSLIALLALGYGLWIVVEHYIEGHDIPGWATLVAGTMFLAGVQLLSIGILGEYIGRIFDEVKGRPIYLLGQQRGRASGEMAAAGEDASTDA
jgi:glycosyltransferase involved in cell wall biosynthesis